MLEASVIVPTRDRAAYLSVALESLIAQDLGQRQATRWSSSTTVLGRAPAPPPCGRRKARRSPCAMSSVQGTSGPELRSQHRHRPRRFGAVRRVRRRRRRGSAWAGCGPCSRACTRTPTRSCSAARSMLRLEGFSAASLRPGSRLRSPALDAGPGGSRGRRCMGRQHGHRPARVRPCRAALRPGRPVWLRRGHVGAAPARARRSK